MASAHSKKRSQSKRRKSRQGARDSGGSRFGKWIRRLTLLAILVLLGVGAVYYFGSFAVRGKMDGLARRAIDSARVQTASLPPLKWALDRLYDSIPGSEGFLVDGGELGLADSHFLAGPPQSRRPVRLLANHSYHNLYDEREKQSICVAFKIGGAVPAHTENAAAENEGDSDAFLIDSRIPHLRPESLAFGAWQPRPLVPPGVLAESYGKTGSAEARLATNLVPMTDAFADALWKPLMRELAVNYSRRFGEIWIYTGPVQRPESSKLSTGIPVPDGFFVIVLDLTDEGGLRALAFLIPYDAEAGNLQAYLTSISKIESATGLTFLPDADFATRQNLGSWISPRLW